MKSASKLKTELDAIAKAIAEKLKTLEKRDEARRIRAARALQLNGEAKDKELAACKKEEMALEAEAEELKAKCQKQSVLRRAAEVIDKVREWLPVVAQVAEEV